MEELRAAFRCKSAASIKRFHSPFQWDLSLLRDKSIEVEYQLQISEKLEEINGYSILIPSWSEMGTNGELQNGRRKERVAK